jgi:hypothetical protein
MTVRIPWTIGAAVVAIAVAVAGCGSQDGGDVPADPAATVKTLLTALGARDGDQACRLLSSEARTRLAATRGGSCEDAVAHLRSSESAEWAAMARGDVSVDEGAGLDDSRFSVSYDFHGPWTSDGMLSRRLPSSGFAISVIPPPASQASG